MTFKLGDKVRVASGMFKDRSGYILEIHDDGPYVTYSVYLEGQEVFFRGRWGHDKWLVKTPPAGTNGYYDFPGDVKVRQISAHLTGYGAQALQYVARATRLNGKNKGDLVLDLMKAIDFIRWEIERLQGESK